MAESMNAAAGISAESSQATLVDLRAACEQRAVTYGLLSRLFRVEVDRELLDTMKGMRFPAKSGNDMLDRGHREIAAFMSGVWDDTLRELAVDYTRVFIGYGSTAYSAAYPNESVYTSEKRLLMQAARDDVLKLYRRNELEIMPEWTNNEDHIALELEFMRVMATRTADAAGKNDENEVGRLLEVQFDFLQNHLRRWTPMMTEDMRRFAKTKFYLGLADMTEGFLDIDAGFLSELLSESNAVEEEDGFTL